MDRRRREGVAGCRRDGVRKRQSARQLCAGHAISVVEPFAPGILWLRVYRVEGDRIVYAYDRADNRGLYVPAIQDFNLRVSDEHVTWVRGHVTRDSEEGKALIAIAVMA